MNDIKIVFMGTPDFAEPALKRLYDESFNVTLAVTQPDKPKGRKMIITPPPVKELASELNIPVFQPTTFKNPEAVDRIKAEDPDFIVVAAYGKILPKAVLDIPKYGCVNIHASLLPRFRGASPIQQAIIQGDKVTGITTMLMDEGLDTGDILETVKVEIGENETAGELFDRLSSLGGDIIVSTLKGIIDGTVKPAPQPTEGVTYAPMLKREDSIIDWSACADSIHNKIRGLSPWPVAETLIYGKRIKIYSSLKTDMTKDGADGEIFAEKDRLFVRCGDSELLEITSLQPDGSKVMAVSDYLRGHTFEKGAVFGK